MHTPEHSQLGKVSAYIDQYDASLLFPLPRETKRREIGITGAIPFLGADLWTAFELSWLNLKGKPQVAIAHITIPCESTHIVESKSFKLYLNSFNNTRMDSADAVRERIREDVSRAIWDGETVKSSAGVRLLGVSASNFGDVTQQLTLDDLLASAPAAEQEWHAAEETIDAIRTRFGSSAIGPASAVEADGLRLVRRGAPLVTDAGPPTLI